MERVVRQDMKITEDFILNILHQSELNQAQCKLLGVEYPMIEIQLENLVDTELDKRVSDLLVLLRGKIAIKTQQQLIKNYGLLESLSCTSEDDIEQDNKIKDSSKSKITRIYCDGACKNNPGEAGSGLAIYDSSGLFVLYFGDYLEHGTNNIAELNALRKALQIASEVTSEDLIEIFSDSQYSIDCICKWSYSWKKNDWKKKGGEIKNLQIIQESHELYDRIKNKIKLQHVKGHSGIEGNELADRMAVFSINSKNYEYQTFNDDNVSAILNMPSY